MLLGFRIFFSIRKAALLALLQPNRNRWLEPGAFGGLKSHVGVGESWCKGFQQAGAAGHVVEAGGPKKRPGHLAWDNCYAGAAGLESSFSISVLVYLACDDRGN